MIYKVPIHTYDYMFTFSALRESLQVESNFTARDREIYSRIRINKIANDAQTLQMQYRGVTVVSVQYLEKFPRK